MIKYRYDPNRLEYVKIKERKNNKVTTFFSKLFVFGFIGYFIIGYLFVYLKKIDFQVYLNIAGILGGAASSIGLFSFFTSKLKRNDIEEIGIEYFKEVINASDNLKRKEKDLSEREKELGKKEKELKQLEVKKAKLELLVQKTSMLIYLKDQLKRLETNILKIIQKDNELIDKIVEREIIIGQLKELNEEIEKNDESKEIDEIVNLIKNNKSTSKNKSTSISQMITETLTQFIRI